MLKLSHNEKYRFTVETPSHVLVKLVNIIGMEMATLINEPKDPGSYEVKYEGNGCPAGIYYYKLYTLLPASENGGTDWISIPEHPGKKFKLIDTKEVLII
jgi:hypothetical protein